MKVTCFGEMGGPYYSDQIIGSADKKQSIIDHCKTKGYKLDQPSWNEYFIKEVEF
tara:strand:- start:1085 stop:1249 length:165 start_codon:yes stop_codon:yes gene_type:complete